MAEKPKSTKTDAMRAAREKAEAERQARARDEKRRRCKHPPERRDGFGTCEACGERVGSP